MKQVLKASVVATTILAIGSSAALAADRQVRVYNWSDYIAEDTIDKFSAATSIKVTYDVFDSNEVLEAKVLSGQSGYDVVVPTTDFLAKQIQAGAYQKLDRSKIPNWKNLDTKLLASIETYDPGHQYGVPYQWGTTGIGYNVEKVAAILGEDFDTVTWDMVLKPEVISKLSSCGVSMLDAPSEMIPIALNYLGLNPNSTNAADYDKTEKLLLSVRPYVTYFHSSKYISDLANGDICVAVGWSGDVFQAMARAEEAENGVEIAYVIPAEGAPAWSDMMAIPKDAKNVDEAHAYINFILDAQIGADITNYVWYGSPNAAAREFIDQEILDDPGIFPGDEVKLFSFEVLPAKIDRIATRSWTKIKAGR